MFISDDVKDKYYVKCGNVIMKLFFNPITIYMSIFFVNNNKLSKTDFKCLC